VMHYFMTVPAAVVASIVGLQLAFLAVQFLGSIIKGGEVDNSSAIHAAECAIIVPAHDEEGSIVGTIRAIQSQLNPADRLIVVADNCSDETANLASESGAETIERKDVDLRGKGFALDRGIRYIAEGPVPKVVVFIDADCVAAPGCIGRLVNMVESTGRPVQGKYLMHATVPNGATRIAEFAFKIKNYIRPGGGSQFGLPCLLYGTGMAFPWVLIRTSLLANGHLAEDLKLAIDLSLLGFPPVYCDKASCYSTFPETKNGLFNQRKRWEHGYFSSVTEYIPRLLMKAFTSRDWRLFAVALDFSIPPLGLMLMITMLLSCFGVVSILLGANIPLAPILVAYFPFFTMLIVLIWYFHGRQIISSIDLLAVIKHVVRRIAMLWGFLTQPQREWVRTERKDRQIRVKKDRP
jgi:cellulose synthase/poly-beta-1,6-N-acetylglucosamine synthase-like glycosyltransferase